MKTFTGTDTCHDGPHMAGSGLDEVQWPRGFASAMKVTPLPVVRANDGREFKADGRTSDGVPYWKDRFAPLGGIFIHPNGNVERHWGGVADAANEVDRLRKELAERNGDTDLLRNVVREEQRQRANTLADRCGDLRAIANDAGLAVGKLTVELERERRKRGR